MSVVASNTQVIGPKILDKLVDGQNRIKNLNIFKMFKQQYILNSWLLFIKANLSIYERW